MTARERLAELRGLREKIVDCRALLLGGIELLACDGIADLCPQRIVLRSQHAADRWIKPGGRGHGCVSLTELKDPYVELRCLSTEPRV